VFTDRRRSVTLLSCDMSAVRPGGSPWNALRAGCVYLHIRERPEDIGRSGWRAMRLTNGDRGR
jgi:hypothetical protein